VSEARDDLRNWAEENSALRSEYRRGGMTVIIAGSRTITDPAIVDTAIKDSGFSITKVLSGGATGVDMQGELWAKQNGIPFDRVRPPYGRGIAPKLAPKIRNWAMAVEADALVAVWDGFSGGAAHMIATMILLKKPVWITKPPEEEGRTDDQSSPI